MAKKRKIKKAFKYGTHTLDLIWDHKNLEARGNMGDVCHSRARVRIDPELSKSKRDQTAVHELLHLAADVCDAELKESEIKVMAMVLAQLLEPYLDLPDPEGGG